MNSLPTRCPRALLRLLRAPERIRRWWFMVRVNRAYARLRADPVAWAEELEEWRLWDRTLMDGLEDDPWPQGPTGGPRGGGRYGASGTGCPA